MLWKLTEFSGVQNAIGHQRRMNLTVLFFLCVGLSIIMTAFKGDSGWNMKPQRPRVGKVWTIPSMSLFSPGFLVSLWRQEFGEQNWRAQEGWGIRERVLQMPIRQILNFSTINLSILQNKPFNFIWDFGFRSCRFMQCAKARPREVHINDVTDSVRMLFGFTLQTCSLRNFPNGRHSPLSLISC